MSLDKAINHGKEKRKPYRGSKGFDSSCRNHGSCSYCMNSRIHNAKKWYGKTENQEEEYWAALAGGGDPTNVDMDYSDDLMERFGFNPNDPYDIVRSEMWWNLKIDEEIKK